MKKLPQILAFALSICILSFSIFCRQRLVANSEENVQKPAYNAVIDVWQLDMIEGGTGSRKNFLQKIAQKFEEENSGIALCVSVETVTSANEKMKSGIYPDVLSFSAGLSGYESRAVALDFGEAYGGIYGKKTYAVAWAVGGYVLIKHSGSNADGSLCYVSQNTFTQPLIAYYLSGKRLANLTIDTPLNAWTNFASDKNSVLLGTQRDLFRVNSRNIECDVEVLGGFSDLIQYAAVTSNDEEKIAISKAFVKMLTECSSSELESIGMLKPSGDWLYGDDSVLKAFNGNQITSTISVFTNADELMKMQDYLANFDINDEEKLDLIKNILQ